MENWNELPSVPDDGELKKIRKSLNRHDRKTILTTLALALVVVLLATFVIAPAVESLYWSPYTSDYTESDNDLKLMLEAYTELFQPGKKLQSMIAGDTGFASFDLALIRTDTATGEKEYLNGSLIRGTLELDYLFFDYGQARVLFNGNNSLPEEMMIHYRDRSLEKLSGLPEYVTVKALAFFPDDLTMEQLQKLIFEYNYDARNGVDLKWVGVRNAPMDAEHTPLACGFSTDLSGSLADLNDVYPHLGLLTVEEDGSHLTEHFKSLLRFSADQVDKDHGLPIGTLEGNYYREILNYVEENGVLSYGCLVTGTPEGLLQMLEDGTASTLILTDGWIDVS